MPGTITLITCVALPVPPSPPGIRLPSFGYIQKARDGLQALPSLSTYLCKLQDQLAAVLAPLKMILEILDAVMGIFNCIKAVPKAVVTFNPKPIFDCIKNLQKAIKVLLSYIPPFSWMLTLIDIMGWIIDLIDEMILLFQDLDAMITRQINGYLYAQQMGNTDLQTLIDCKFLDVKNTFLNIKPLLLMMPQLSDVMLQVIYTYTNDPKTKLALERNKLYKAYYPVAFVAIEAGVALPDLPAGLGLDVPITPQGIHAKVPVPPLGKLVACMVDARNTACDVSNAMALIVGGTQRTTRIAPTFSNF